MFTTSSSIGKVSMTYSGGEVRQLKDEEEMATEPKAKRIRTEVGTAGDSNESLEWSPTREEGGSKRDEDTEKAKTKPSVPELPQSRISGQRLWHEPPILNHSDFDIYNDLQRLFKEYAFTRNHQMYSKERSVAWRIRLLLRDGGPQDRGFGGGSL